MEDKKMAYHVIEGKVVGKKQEFKKKKRHKK